MPETRGPGPGPQDGGRRGLLAWCVFDWANSAYPSVIVTFVFAAYFTSAVAESPEAGTGQWGTALAVSALVVALLAPVLGALADQGGRRKPWLGAFTVLAIVCSGLLWHIEPDPAYAVLALVLVAVGNGAFEFGQVFYNAMLPEISPRRMIGRISGWAWSMGYAGGLVCLALSLLLFVQPERTPFGLDREAAEHVRITGPLVGLWFAVFAVPLFLITPDRPAAATSWGVAVRLGLATLWATLRELPGRPLVGRFLIARMIYTDGLNTLFAFGGIYAAGTIGMSYEEILVFGVLLNIAAGLGAAAFAWIDDLFGARRTIIAALVGLFVFGGAVLLVDSRVWFTVLACAIGVFIGPAQAASRSYLARLAPPEIRTELFGLYALSGKATAFVGPALVGWVTVWADSQRAGMATILIFFLVGLVLVWPLVDPPEPAAEEGAP